VVLGRCSTTDRPSHRTASQDGSAPGRPSMTAAAAIAASWKTKRVWLLQLLDAPGTSWVLMIMTMFVIFQEDVKYAMLPPTADLAMEAVTLAILLLFLTEIGELLRAGCCCWHLGDQDN